MSVAERNGTAVTATWGGQGGDWAVAVHGGAGVIAANLIARHVQGCRAAAAAAATVLRAGGSALDAVECAARILEDDDVFNAGTGACLNADGRVELDAAVMEGSGLRAGAVCALPPFRNPIAIARAALEDGRHVLYAGEGAAQFAVEHGFERVSSDSMTTPGARAQWHAARANSGRAAEGLSGGTIGAVARDIRGSVAAATSTGGLVDKHPGRVGDSPLLGAGTYADDDGGACSATGHGEAAMRLALAKTATDGMRGRLHPEDVARAVIGSLGSRLAAGGGVILVDRAGRIGLARNTPAMAWAAEAALFPLTSGA